MFLLPVLLSCIVVRFFLVWKQGREGMGLHSQWIRAWEGEGLAWDHVMLIPRGHALALFLLYFSITVFLKEAQTLTLSS